MEEQKQLRPDELEGVVAVADVPSSDGTVFAAEALRTMHDGVRFFWDDVGQRLLWRGPRGEIQPGRMYVTLTTNEDGSRINTRAGRSRHRNACAHAHPYRGSARSPITTEQPPGPCITVYRRGDKPQE